MTQAMNRYMYAMRKAGSIAGMKNKVPFIDPSPDPDKDPNEPRKSELLTVGPKATFQWPQDCLWPFVDHKGDNDT